MSDKLSLPEMLADLEQRVAFHREQEGIHARQESVHREERARHAAALAQAAQQLATLQEAASVAEALREAAPLPAPAEPEEPAGEGLRMISKLAALVVQGWPADRSFGASDVAAEVERRFGARLRRPVSVPNVSASLRRLCRRGAIRQLRPGVSHAEALYARIDPAFP